MTKGITLYENEMRDVVRLYPIWKEQKEKGSTVKWRIWRLERPPFGKKKHAWLQRSVLLSSRSPPRRICAGGAGEGR